MFNFNNVIGNKKIVEFLQKSYFYKKLVQSYIIYGTKGMGKKEIAYSFSKLILCENPQNGDCCNKCISCLTFESKNNPDVVYIKKEKNVISIDTVRNKIIKDLEVKPFKKYKIFIIEDSESMTIQAQNAILKTIEEPPNYAIFIFISNNISTFLPTILSRCIILKLKPLRKEEIKTSLVCNYNVSSDLAELAFIYSQGSFGKAKEIALSENFKIFRQDVILELEKLIKEDLINLYRFINILEKQKENIQEVLDIFFLIYRDILIFKNTNEESFIIQKDIKDKIIYISNILNNKTIFESIKSIIDAKFKIHRNANFNNVMECLFIKLKEK